MKNFIILLLFTTLMNSNIYADESNSDARDNLQIGAKVGTNYSNVYDSQGEDFEADSRFGLVLGGYISIPIGKYIGVQPELLFSQKGFNGTGRILGSPYDFTRTTSYLDIPILFSFRPSESLTLLAGPQYSYLLSQKDVFTNSVLTIEQEQEFENDNIRKNILCFLGGLDFNHDNFVVGTRVGWDLFNNNGDGTDTTPRYKNVWFQLTIGFRLYYD